MAAQFGNVVSEGRGTWALTEVGGRHLSLALIIARCNATVHLTSVDNATPGLSV